MSQNKALIAELQMEAANTRKMLERVPHEYFDYKPHTKSMTKGRLAAHVAELPSWIGMVLNTDGFDLNNMDHSPALPTSNAELLAIHDKTVADAVAALENAKDEDFAQPWTLRSGEKINFTLPKNVVIRSFAYNHLFHHRGQLSVYLRMNDLYVPGMYGPSADDMEAMTAAAAGEMASAN